MENKKVIPCFDWYQVRSRHRNVTTIRIV